MRGIFGLSLFLLIFPIANALVIVSPTVYFVTISIATFVANSIIGFLALIAVSGLLNKTFFGKKMSDIFAFAFTSIKKMVIGIISMVIALFLINPIEIFSIIQGAIVAGIIFGVLYILSEYSKFRISNSQKKSSILKSTVIFSTLILIIFTVSSMTSMEIKLIAGDESQSQFGIDVIQKSLGNVLNDSIGSSSAGIAAREVMDAPAKKPSSAGNYEPIYDADKGGIILNELLFFPESDEECDIKVGQQSFVFKPAYSCHSGGGFLPERIYCPVKVSFDEINQFGEVKVTARGSCNDSFLVTLKNGFVVEVS